MAYALRKLDKSDKQKLNALLSLLQSLHVIESRYIKIGYNEKELEQIRRKQSTLADHILDFVSKDYVVKDKDYFPDLWVPAK